MSGLCREGGKPIKGIRAGLIGRCANLVGGRASLVGGRASPVGRRANLVGRRELIKEGKQVKINGVSGKVVKLSLLDTRIKTKKGDLIYMPNSVVLKSKITQKKK